MLPMEGGLPACVVRRMLFHPNRRPITKVLSAPDRLGQEMRTCRFVITDVQILKREDYRTKKPRQLPRAYFDGASRKSQYQLRKRCFVVGVRNLIRSIGACKIFQTQALQSRELE